MPIVSNPKALNTCHIKSILEEKEGKCVKRGLKFGPLHKCLKKHLRVLILRKDKASSTKVDFVMVKKEDEGDEDREEALEFHSHQLKLPLYSIRVISQPYMMKLMGKKIGSVLVIVMIDSGACHNFISNELVESLGLLTKTNSKFSIRLGVGRKRSTRGICNDLELFWGQPTSR